MIIINTIIHKCKINRKYNHLTPLILVIVLLLIKSRQFLDNTRDFDVIIFLSIIPMMVFGTDLVINMFDWLISGFSNLFTFIIGGWGFF